MNHEMKKSESNIDVDVVTYASEMRDIWQRDGLIVLPELVESAENF